MTLRQLHTTHKFEKDVARAKRRGKDTAKLRIVIDWLVHRQMLPRELNDHPLKGQYKGLRDVHLEPDWILIYKADEHHVWLLRTGTHADLFGN
jgi:mRNA interferase YafQ